MMARTGSPAPVGVFGTPQAAYAITPSDTVYLPFVPDWIYVGSTGNISMAFPGNAGPVVFNSVPVGRLDVNPTRIFATNTTASDICIVKNGDLPNAR
jgi:hypothetical protein